MLPAIYAVQRYEFGFIVWTMNDMSCIWMPDSGRIFAVECHHAHWSEDEYGNEFRIDCGNDCEY